MYCVKCGQLNNDTNNWCTRCGHRIAPISQMQPKKVEKKPVYKKAEAKPKKIKDYFCRSIFSALIGSISLGAAAVVFSGMTRTELAVGDMERAAGYSRKAKIFGSLSFAIAFVKAVCVIMVLIYSSAVSVVDLFFG